MSGPRQLRLFEVAEADTPPCASTLASVGAAALPTVGETPHARGVHPGWRAYLDAVGWDALVGRFGPALDVEGGDR